MAPDENPMGPSTATPADPVAAAAAVSTARGGARPHGGLEHCHLHPDWKVVVHAAMGSGFSVFIVVESTSTVASTVPSTEDARKRERCLISWAYNTLSPKS